MRICKQTSLALKSKGITSGIVAETGHGVSQLVPIFQDFIIDNCTQELAHISGAEVDSQLEKYLSQSSLLDIRTDRDTDLFKRFKTKFGQIRLNSEGKQNEFIIRKIEKKHDKGSGFGRGFLLKVSLIFV